MNKLLPFVLARLAEPSTRLAIGTFFSLVGFHVQDFTLQAVFDILGAVGVLLGATTPEKTE